MSTAGSPLTVDQVFGLWDLTGPGGACLLALQRIPPGGVHLERCAGGLGAKATGWRLASDGFELIDAHGRRLITFAGQGPDAFTGRDEAGGVYRLERGADI